MTSKTSSRPGRQLRNFSVSKVKTAVRCEKQYYFRYIYPKEVLGKKGELVPSHSSLPLKKGSWMHDLLAEHWAGRSWEAKHDELSQEFNKLFWEERELFDDLPVVCNQLMRRYLRYHAEDDSKYEVARLPKGKPAIEFVIEFPLEKWGVHGNFKGRIDLLVKDLEYGGYWIRDAKWVKSIPGPDERMMSPQNIMYVAVMRLMGWDLRGFIYDYGRTKEPTVPPILQRGTVTTRKNLDTDVLTYLMQVRNAHGKKWKSYARTVYKTKIEELRGRESLWFRRERIPVDGPRIDEGFAEFIEGCKRIKKRNAYIRNYLYNCKFNCSYHEPCVASFQGMDIERLMKSQFMVEPERYSLEEVN